jgi:hypothetical protein
MTDSAADFERRLSSLWRASGNVDLQSCFLYFICVTDPKGARYTYIGKARDQSRLNEYRNNMLKIRAGRERGKRQNYRAVHFAMYWALQNGWKIDFFPLENCSKEQLNTLEGQRIRERQCNLNGARTWRVANMESLSLGDLLRPSVI